MRASRGILSLTAVATSLLAGGCGEPPLPSTIDAYVASLPHLPVQPAKVVEGTRSKEVRDGDYACSTQNLQETRQLDRIVGYAANSDSLWPGALVAGRSIGSGEFTQLVLPRAPATISVSLENLAGTKSATIAQPSLSTYRDALAGILASEITGSTPANQYSEIERVHSSAQLDMALGVKASWGVGVASLKSSFDFSRKDVLSRYVVRYTQAYYTVDLDAPSRPSDVFDPSVTVQDLADKLGDGEPPVYVSSVTYGRMVIFTFESAYSAEEMSAALGFAYQGGVDVKGDVSVTYKDILSRSKITAFILGGDGGAAAQTIDSYDALIAFIKAGGNYSRTSPGAPIAYKLAYLDDSSPARISYTTDYDVKECVRVSQKVRVSLDGIKVINCANDGNYDLELWGNVTAEGSAGPVSLFSKDRASYVVVAEGKTFPPAGPLSEAVIDVTPQAGQTVRLSAHLYDADPVYDDDLGTEVLVNPFETGWRKTTSTILTGTGAQVQVTYSLAPI